MSSTFYELDNKTLSNNVNNTIKRFKYINNK